MENKDRNGEVTSEANNTELLEQSSVGMIERDIKNRRKAEKKLNRKKMSKGKKALVITLIVLASIIVLLLIAVICGKLYLEWRLLNKIGRTYDSELVIIEPKDEYFENLDQDKEAALMEEYQENSETDETEFPEIDPNDVKWANITKFDDTDHINILLVGQDRYEDTGARQRSDTMILCSINTKTNEVSLISFLRDLYVQIPGGYSDNRLNATYVFGGFPLLNETIEKNFGIHIDYNFEVDFTGFTEIIDYFGGIDVDLTAAEADWLNNVIIWVFKHSPVKEGVNRLNGEQALHYARIRKLDSDFGRTERQRKVVNLVFEKLSKLSLSELFAVAEDLLPYITTDMTNNDIWGLIFEIGPDIFDIKLSSYSVPSSGDFYYARIRGMSVIVPDLPAIKTRLEEEYLPY